MPTAPGSSTLSSITGAWVLDLSRSDTFEGYLRCLGAPEVAVQAQIAQERVYQSRNVISLDESRLVIHKDTAVNQHTERYLLDQEQVAPVQSGRGVNRATASLAEDGEKLDGYVLATTNCDVNGRENAETVEARQLLEGGLEHVQQIFVRNIVTGGQFTTTRTWTRVPMTEDDRRLCASN